MLTCAKVCRAQVVSESDSAVLLVAPRNTKENKVTKEVRQLQREKKPLLVVAVLLVAVLLVAAGERQKKTATHSN
jgi:hypothetical protein